MNDYYSNVRQLCELMTIPFHLMGSVMAGYWVGGWIDQQFRIDSCCQVSLMILGLLGGLWESGRVIYRISEKQNKA